jgi:hypothetical protein
VQVPEVLALFPFAELEVDFEELCIVGVLSSVKFKNCRINTVHLGKKLVHLLFLIFVWGVEPFAVFICTLSYGKIFGKRSTVDGIPCLVKFIIRF